MSDAWNGPVNPEKIEGEPVEFSNNIKKISRFLGANLVGICELDKRWVYEDAEVPHEYAISMAIEMESELLLNEPSYLENTASGIAYSKARYVSVILAQFIRGIGYNAYANVNERVLEIPIAIDAGLGEMGRNGLLITPEYGPRVRLCSVTTDLPLEKDDPIDFGIQHHCESCEKCARACPARAIKFNDRTAEINNISNRRGLLRWPVDFEKCLIFWGGDKSERQSCAKCIGVCPFTHSRERKKALCNISDLFVKANGKLHGRVYDMEAKPIAGAKVSVGDIYASSPTGDDGSYLLNNIKKGVYKSSVIKSGYYDVIDATINIEPDITTIQDFKLIPINQHLINVMIDDAFGSAGGVDTVGIEGVEVDCWEPNYDIHYYGITNSNGEIQLKVQPGPYIISIKKDGYYCYEDNLKKVDAFDGIKTYLNYSMVKK